MAGSTGPQFRAFPYFPSSRAKAHLDIPRVLFSPGAPRAELCVFGTFSP